MARTKGAKDKEPRKNKKSKPLNKLKIKRTTSNAQNSLTAKRVKNV